MKEEYALGKNGEIQEVISKEEFIRRFPKEHFEIKPRETATQMFYATSSATQEKTAAEIHKCVKQIYEAWGKFGPYGDVISIMRLSEFENSWLITTLGRRAFPKPALAVDCVIFVRDDAGNYFFVGIKRSKEPGKGKSAFVGGFIDVNGYKMETTLEAMLREVHEEVGVSILMDTTRRHSFISHEIPAVAILANSKKDYSTTMLYYAGDTETGDEEKLEPLGMRRVHRTFVYTCLLTVPGTQTAETVREYFKAGSDAAELAIIPFLPDDPESVKAATESFGISHHREMFPKALALVTK